MLDVERAGTQLAVDVLTTMTSLAGSAQDVLGASADWQIYQRDREMYGSTYDWHTLEGPSVRLHEGTYYCLYSGGSWQTEGYAVSWARASSPLADGPHTPGPSWEERELPQ